MAVGRRPAPGRIPTGVSPPSWESSISTKSSMMCVLSRPAFFLRLFLRPVGRIPSLSSKTPCWAYISTAQI